MNPKLLTLGVWQIEILAAGVFIARRTLEDDFLLITILRHGFGEWESIPYRGLVNESEILSVFELGLALSEIFDGDQTQNKAS